MKQFKTIEKKWDEAEKIRKQIYKSVLKWLTEQAEARGGEIAIHEYDEDGIQTDDRCYTVSYDGGNHPEYASNMFSEVDRVFVQDGKLYLEIEDDPEYSIDRISWDDVYYLAEFININIVKQ